MKVDFSGRWKAFSGAFIFAGCLLLLTACTLGSKPLKNPELACQTIPCVCEEDDASIFEDAEQAKILWRKNGDAYCPDGFHLEKKEKGDSFITDHGG